MSRVKYTRTECSTSFICSNCGFTVPALEFGSANRNHCPHCLHSLHVDLKTGDRRSACKGTMVPIGIWVKENGEWAIIHRCTKCGFIRTNRIAADDNEVLLFTLAARAMSQLPFPAEKTLQKITERNRLGELIHE